MVNKSLFSVAIGLLAAIATANPVAVSPTDAVDAIATPSPVSRADLPDLGIPEEGLPLPGLVIHSPGYNKTAAAEEGNIEARGYGPTCVGCLLFNTGTDLVLQCTCGKASGGRNTPRYNLNQCVGNSNGQLVWWVNGGWQGSCWNVRFPTNTNLYATCRQINGGERDSSINLDEHIQNWNGVLGCDFK